MDRYGITMYVPKDTAGLNLKRILRTLIFKYPALKCKFRIVTTSTFTSDVPNKPPGQRSRIGDMIVLLDGDELAAKIRPFPEDHRFVLSRGFSVTLKGGIRGEDHAPQFERSFSSALMMNAAEEGASGRAV